MGEEMTTLPEALRQQVARWLDRAEPRVRLVSDDLTRPAGADDPTRWRDGGYCAVFEAR